MVYFTHENIRSRDVSKNKSKIGQLFMVAGVFGLLIFSGVIGLRYDEKNSISIFGSAEASNYYNSITTPSRTPRQKVCFELIGNIKRAYSWDINVRSRASRPYLAATIQIYKNVNGKVLCEKSVFSIMMEIQNGK